MLEKIGWGLKTVLGAKTGLSSFLGSPKYLRFKVTENCNLRCESCSHWKGEPKESCSLSEVEEVADDLKQNGFTHVGLTGGEPTVRNDLEEVVQIFSERGFSVGVTTNGTSLDESRVRDLYECGLRNIDVSLDGTEEIHNEIVGRDVYGEVMNVLKFISSFAEESELSVTSGSVLSKTTLPEFFDGVEERANIGVPTEIQVFSSSAYFNDNTEDGLWLSPSEADDFVQKALKYKADNPGSIVNPEFPIRWISRYFRNPRVPEEPCTYGSLALCMDSQLEVYPCWSFPSVGNLPTVLFYTAK